MAPKGANNAKKESGRAKKAENEAKKKDAAAAEKEKLESAKWAEDSKGSKSKEEKEEKRKAELAKKAERERLLAEEEAAMSVKKAKATPKASGKKKADTKPAGPGAIAAGGGLASVSSESDQKSGDDKVKTPEEHVPVESFSATGIDQALELMEVVTAKTDKASVGNQAAGIERHPERRFKAAFEAYYERELPRAKADHPGLRLNQYKELIYKQFQKSPENPFNQVVVSYDASKEERVDALEKKNKEVEQRLRERTRNLHLGDN